MECLVILKKCRYDCSIVIDSSPEAVERVLSLTTATLEPNELFPLQAIYGNIVCLRDMSYPEEAIERLCRPYRNHGASSPHVVWRNRGVRRLAQRFSRTCAK